MDLDTKKMYKVSYKINMLPALGEYVSEKNGQMQFNNRGKSLCNLESDELEIYESVNF